ncbi:MAG TPA: fimbria/pilus outer membrane usher protein [Gallionella sp.]
MSCSVAAQPLATPSPSAGNTADQILPLEVIINGARSGTWLLLERNGAIYAPQEAFTEWRVQLPPDAQPIDFQLHGQTYWPLAAVPGYQFRLDYANQSAAVQFSPEVFPATRMVNANPEISVVSPVLPSLFFNYDLNYSTSVLRNAPTVRDMGMLAEIGASNSWGVLTSSHAGRNLTNDPNSYAPGGWVRLETTYTRNYPSENRTFRMGDSTTHAGMWGRNVYFGGIQYGSNFALTPGFVSQPVPALTGMSAAPSTVEMYVNDVLRQVSNVPAGPFSIDNFPLLSGGGDVRMVVRDILGRETVIEQSFFTTPQLLAAGLDDWSIEAGSVRQEMGVTSNRYGPGFASGTWRHGYTNDLTLETRAETTADLQTFGVGAASLFPGQFLGKGSLAISRGENMNGGLWLLGLEHQTLHHSVSFQIQGASRDFHQLGQPETTAPIRQQLAGNWSYVTNDRSAYGIGLATLSPYSGERISTLTGNYSRRIGAHNNLNFTVSRAINGASSTSAGLFLTMPLDGNRIINTSVSNQDGREDFYISAMKHTNLENTLGWRTLAGRQQGETRAEGSLYYTGRYGRLSGDLSTSPDQTTTRVGATGGLVLTDSHLFVTQRVDQSFALAEVAGYRDIGIGLGSNVLTQTDADGLALVPRLVPYQKNSVRLDPGELPLSADISTLEHNVVPAWRSAVKVVFPVRGGRGALLRITLDDGDAAPAGATVQIEGEEEEFYVARRGAAFVTGLQPANVVLLKWNGQQCRLDVILPPVAPDEIPRLGPLLCKGVIR